MVRMTQSEDDMPLDSLIENQLTPEKEKNVPSQPVEMKKFKISDSQFAIRHSQINYDKAEDQLVKFIEENITYDTKKYQIELFKSFLINLVPITEKPQADSFTDVENKENIENPTTPQQSEVTSIESDESEIEEINNDNGFEIEDVGTDEEKEKSKEKEDEREEEKSVTSDEVELVDEIKSQSNECFWFLENGKINSAKEVPQHFQNSDGSGPKLDCSVGGLYYKIFAESHERRMAANVVTKPAHIVHRKLYLTAENKNYPDPVSFMVACRDVYLEKMLNNNDELSIHSFCSQCFRCFETPYDLQVHTELVHQTQHAATCRICEFNFGHPALLLKHMAAVHSMETPQHGLIGAYRCMICKFVSPLYSELMRHYDDYHSMSGWLLCPLCLRVFSNDTTYEHHMNMHTQKAKFHRCQSCRLVFESETWLARHQAEMHCSLSQPRGLTPMVPSHVKAWVRGEADTRSQLFNYDLNETHACRAICLADCSQDKNGPSAHWDQIIVKKKLEQIKPLAPKEFQPQILDGKRRTRNGRVQPEEKIEERSFVNDLSQLLCVLDDDYEPEPVKTVESDFNQRCTECDTNFKSMEELIGHYSKEPLKSHKSSFETHCPIRYKNHLQSYLNGPSLECVRIKDSWIDIGKKLLTSYPNGVKCSCGKTDWDFGNTNFIARHLIFNPRHTLQITESEQHKDDVRNKVMAQRIKRLIQTGEFVPMKQENLEPVIHAMPLSTAARTCASISDKPVLDETHDLCEFSKMFSIRQRQTREVKSLPSKDNPVINLKLATAASGIDLESSILSREHEVTKLSKKEERLMTSIMHKGNVERQNRQKQQAMQQQQATYQAQLLQQTLQKQLQQSSVHFQNTNRLNGNHNRSSLSVRVPRETLSKVAQKRPGQPLMGSVTKQRIISSPRSVIRPPMAKDVKFPVVTHKEIQVEIVPSDMGDENVDYYEIEFKGRKTPNKYNVKPSIKIVKLIGLQSDTNYLIKVFAVRKSVRSDAVMRQVKTAPLPRGGASGIVSDVIELD